MCVRACVRGFAYDKRMFKNSIKSSKFSFYIIAVSSQKCDTQPSSMAEKVFQTSFTRYACFSYSSFLSTKYNCMKVNKRSLVRFMQPCKIERENQKIISRDFWSHFLNIAPAGLISTKLRAS